MKLSVYSVGFLLLFASVNSFAQTTNAVPNNIRATNTLERLTDGGISTGEIMIGMPVPPGDLVGDVYLNEDWKKTTLLLMNTEKLAEGYQCRYNIQANQIEVKTAAGINAISGLKVRSFVWMDPYTEIPVYYVNAQAYSIDGVKQTGFLKVLADGYLPFFKKTTLFVKQPNYKPELHMGNRDTQIIKKEIFYYARNNELVEIKGKSKKKFLEIFGDVSADIEKYIEANDIDASDEIGRAMIFDYYNKNLSPKK